MDRPRGDKAFYDSLFDALDQHLERGADPELMMAALGTKLAEVLARCIHSSHMPRAKAETWIKRQQTMLHKVTWSCVQEIQAQPRTGDEGQTLVP
jgi:hypothetical protein